MVVAKYSAEYAEDGVLFLALSPGLVETGRFETRRCRHFTPYAVHVRCAVLWIW